MEETYDVYGDAKLDGSRIRLTNQEFEGASQLFSKKAVESK